MNEKEAKAQEALGLLNTYEGYITIDSKEYIIYEIKALAYKSARHRLKRAVKVLNSSLDASEQYMISWLVSSNMKERADAELKNLKISERRKIVA